MMPNLSSNGNITQPGKVTIQQASTVYTTGPPDIIFYYPFENKDHVHPEPSNITYNSNVSTYNSNASTYNQSGNQSHDAEHGRFYISRIVIIPAIIMMTLFSLLLLYVLLRYMRPILKLYLSVIFYAASILFFAAQLILFLLYEYFNPDSNPDCDGRLEKVWRSLQLAGIIMPAMAVLVATLTRFLFLAHPFDWRNVLRFRNQAALIQAAVVVTFAIGLLPLADVCTLEDSEGQCVFVKVWSVRCVSCIFLTIGIGLLVPTVAVIVLYFFIYGIVHRARLRNSMLFNATKRIRYSVCRELVTHTKQMKAEREDFPWSLIVMLVLNLASAVPWVIMVGAPELFTRFDTRDSFVVPDVVYSLALVAIAASPIAYLMTTRVVRDKTRDLLKGNAKSASRRGSGEGHLSMSS